GPNDIPTRVGAHTDLALVESGQEQARKLGRWLRAQNYIPDAIYCSELKRTKKTAELALKEAAITEHIYPLQIFNEIDYGPDENKPEDEVIARIGKEAIENWDKNAVVPDGWKFDPKGCIQNWQNFAQHLIDDQHDCTLVVTSNGVARFAPHLAGNFEEFATQNKIKLSTGALGILEFKNDAWRVHEWNVKP
ncbi:MAG: histidine phosphatase family protein, partial [Alphaproteobacteria bacterium]|nr:histidine phosphatase family protein [Alphaproteobacteria bacterium]